MNEAMEKTSCKCKKFTDEKFLTRLAPMIGASEFSQKVLSYSVIGIRALIMMRTLLCGG
jgi:hypothetical protein